MEVALPLGIGFLGVMVMGLIAAVAGIAYAVLWVWMVVDGVLRADADYPGTEPNRKVLWVVAMVLLHPAAIVYFVVVYLKARRAREATPVAYTPTVAPPVPWAPESPVPPAPEPPRPL